MASLNRLSGLWMGLCVALLFLPGHANAAVQGVFAHYMVSPLPGRHPFFSTTR